MFHRRDILKFLLSAILSPTVFTGRSYGIEHADEDKGGSPRIRKYNILGKTGLRVSDIGFGVSVSTDPSLLVEAYHRGINYFDLSPFYTWSTEMLSSAFALDEGMRREAIVASKVECDNFFYQFSKKPMHKVILECVDRTLQKLNREYVDILQIHSVGESGAGDLDWLDPNTQLGGEAEKLFDILKRQGKIRFTGITSHGPHQLETIVEKAVASDRFDMMMVALNFMQSPDLKRVLALAESRGIGVVAMKALANARKLKIVRPGGAPISNAAITWANHQPGIQSVNITIPDREHLDAYLAASGRQFSLSDHISLAYFRASKNRDYCRVGCGLCSSFCPHGVDIPSMLRFDQYRRDYNLPDLAKERYHSLPESKRPTACLNCESAPCERGCPFDVPIHARLVAAHHHLHPTGTVPS